MQRFAALYAELDDTRATSAKRAAMQRYFAQVPPQDAAWGLHFLLGHRLKRLIAPTRLRAWIAEATGLPGAVIEDSYAHVGDLAETIALLFDARRDSPAQGAPALHVCVAELQALQSVAPDLQRDAILRRWRSLPLLECLLFNKLLTGALRVGVSRGLAAQALAAHAGLEPAQVQSRLMGRWQPGAATFRALLAADAGQRDPSQPYPFCLAAALDDAPGSLGPARDFCAEWKWDGIRAQLIRRAGRTYLWSRGEELLEDRFPEIEAAAARLPDGTVLDGEVLAWNPQGVLPFAVLQRRIGRGTPGPRLLAEAPVAFVAYDLIEQHGTDLRTLPLQVRRQRMGALLDALGAAGQDMALRRSERLPVNDWPALAARREAARRYGVEGLMLKRLDSPYVAGRKRGHWWKWKLDPLCVDTVLLYAQAGHGRRSNLYTDYTLAVRDGEALVPVAKAYSGLDDAELVAMDHWIRAHTRERFGPVRSVEPLQVFEIAFEGIQPSPRHKAGVALRFPRIARWRRDKTVADIDTLEDLLRLQQP